MKIDKKQLLMSYSPHIRTDVDTRSIMLDVIIALFFPFIMACYFFGPRAITLTVVSVASSVFFEWGYCRVTKQKNSTGDLSAAVTGMLIALCLPVSAPFWMPVVGSFFAIVLVKKVYGGLGKNFLNPALSAQAFLFSWPVLMSLWIKPSLGPQMLPAFGNISREALTPDVIASVTPLAKMKLGFLPATAMGDIDVITSLRDAAMGNVAGCLGEVSAVLIAAAAVYLIIRRVITLHIPLSYILTVAIITFIFPKGQNPNYLWSLFNVFSGGLMFGAVFMATDYTTSPTSPFGKVIYGICCGILTVLLRYFGMYNEGVTFAILLMNCATFIIDRVFLPRRYGAKKRKAGVRDGE